jgi:hypothetical protein
VDKSLPFTNNFFYVQKFGLTKAIIVALFLACLTAYPQQPSKDSMNLKALDFLIGDWTITVDARLSKDGPWERSKARSSIKKAVGNTIFEEEVIGTRQNREWVARCWIAVDNRTSRYQWAFVDSDHGVLELYEGDWSGDGLILQKEIIFPQSRVLRRIIYSNFSTDSFTVRSMRSADDGKTWDLTGTSQYERY